MTHLAVAVMEADVEALEWLIQRVRREGPEVVATPSAWLSLSWLPGEARSRA